MDKVTKDIYKYTLKFFIAGLRNLGIINTTKFIFLYLRLFNDVNLKLKNYGKINFNSNNLSLGFALMISNLNDFNEHQKNLVKQFLSQKDEEIIKIDNLKFIKMHGFLFFESFVYESYKVSQGNGELIIDVGANIGDSTLYFANKGYRVLAFEPIKETFEKAKLNIDLNEDLKDKINIVNKGIAYKNGEVKIYFSKDKFNEYSGLSSTYREGKNYELFEVISVESMLKEYEVSPYILKMDCEGCEVDIILKSDLTMFKEIYFEYHPFKKGMEVEPLIEKLKNDGFKLERIEGDKEGGVVKMTNPNFKR
ncbi:MAG: FkbM family methyltransferase [Methanobrevibacter sp.]|jgi:FkbM family methyltransferase|nr:FkbM family methyltransferase [Methanobrevibacter sp.]